MKCPECGRECIYDSFFDDYYCSDDDCDYNEIYALSLSGDEYWK